MDKENDIRHRISNEDLQKAREALAKGKIATLAFVMGESEDKIREIVGENFDDSPFTLGRADLRRK